MGDALSTYQKIRQEPKEVINLANWWLADDDERTRNAMFLGGFRYVTQEVYYQLLRTIPKDCSYTLSTVVVNMVNWTLPRMFESMGRAQVYPYKRKYQGRSLAVCACAAGGLAIQDRVTGDSFDVQDPSNDLAEIYRKELESQAVRALELLEEYWAATASSEHTRLQVANSAVRAVKLLRLRFWEDYTLEELGQEFLITKGRAGQITIQAINRLRAASKKILAEFEDEKADYGKLNKMIAADRAWAEMTLTERLQHNQKFGRNDYRKF